MRDMVIPLGVAAAALVLYWLVRPRYSFAGKHALVTGGSRGLGLVLARELAKRGAKVTVCSRDPAELDRAAADLTARGATVLALPCDVTDQTQVRRMVADATSVHGPVDVLVNNAGVIGVGPLESQTAADYESSLATHVWGPLFAVEAVLPAMRERRAGRVVNIASFGGKVAVPHLVPYCVGKFALVGLSNGMRAELAPHGIVVTTVCPGLLRTGSHLNARFKGRHEEEYAWFAFGDNVPGVSQSAERAARQILGAVSVGDAEIVLSPAAKLATFAACVMPNVTAAALTAVNRWVLPKPGGIGTERRDGHASRGGLSPAFTGFIDRAAARNNESAAGPEPSPRATMAG